MSPMAVCLNDGWQDMAGRPKNGQWLDLPSIEVQQIGAIHFLVQLIEVFVYPKFGIIFHMIYIYDIIQNFWDGSENDSSTSFFTYGYVYGIA